MDTQQLHQESLTLMDDHVIWMRRRRLANQTIITRSGHVLRFLRWAQARGSTLTDADHKLLDAYQAHLTETLCAVSERAVISNLREFYRWAVRDELLPADPTVRLILPRIARRRPRPIREDRLALAFRQADVAMKAILALAAMAGMRAVEIARLSWGDVDLEGELYATGKGGHQRAIWIADCQPLIQILKALRGGRRGPVIPRLDGKPGHNTANTLDKRTNQYLHDLGITETLHQLRHRFGTVGYRAVNDPIAIMKLMGHASLTATVIYADSSSENSRAVIAATGHINAA